MRKELKIIGSKERHVFTATFIRFGFRDGYKGLVKTDEIVSLTCKEIYLYIDKELAGKGIPIEAKNWNIKNKKRSRVPGLRGSDICY